jgi:hypothetical protein
LHVCCTNTILPEVSVLVTLTSLQFHLFLQSLVPRLSR